MNEINQQLEKDGVNTRIVIPFTFSFSTGKLTTPKAMIETEKADPTKREKAKSVFATYCPFCGVKYDQPSAPENVEEVKS
jgi:hypothetical protein